MPSFPSLIHIIFHFHIYFLQVFEKVEVSIKVKEGRAGTRRLVIGFVHNGRDFAEPAGTYGLQCSYGPPSIKI